MAVFTWSRHADIKQTSAFLFSEIPKLKYEVFFSAMTLLFEFLPGIKSLTVLWRYPSIRTISHTRKTEITWHVYTLRTYF